ncbi:MAG: response regulator [Desulfobacter sp.]|nr:response regulator [Desulfobacter sp.]
MTLNSGHPPHKHKVLIVGHKVPKDQTVGPVLEDLGLGFIHDETGEEGLESVRKATTPFSLVLCDQRMPGMKGSQFLAKVKEISPETIRVLITGYSDIKTIIRAVNKGAVQRYISKPLKNDDITQTIRSGIAQYEKYLESQQLYGVAKKQNKKLYELNCELMEATKATEKKLTRLEKEILTIAAQLKQKTAQRPLTQAQAVGLVVKCIDAIPGDSQKELNFLYEKSIQTLYKHFEELALRNGIEMPDPLGQGENHD